MHDEVFERYRHDRDVRTRATMIEAYRPLVYCICRRFLREPQDIEDATQETLLKLIQHVDAIQGSPAAWLSSAAYNSSVDLIRRSISEERRRRGLAQLPRSAQRARLDETITQRLSESMRELDDTARQLLVDRFFGRLPLRVIAGARQTTVSSISRRITQTLRDLARILSDMGVQSVDDLALAQHFHDAALMPDESARESLRFARDWRGPLLQRPTRLLPGWTRPIRVGVYVSYLSTTMRGADGAFHPVELQARLAGLMLDPGFALVSIAEGGTTAHGPIERTIREYELTGGLIDAADTDALRTLDVIIIGINFVMLPAIARAFAHAVRSGVGLLNDWWIGEREGSSGEDVRALMLADSPVYAFHTHPTCGVELRATVIDEHPLLPGLRLGSSFGTWGCGPAFRLVPGARVAVVKDHRVKPHEHHLPGVGTLQMPVWVAGELGRGRIINIAGHAALMKILSISPTQYLTKTLTWLAEPRRELDI